MCPHAASLGGGGAYEARLKAALSLLSSKGAQFTCFTGTKVEILTCCRARRARVTRCLGGSPSVYLLYWHTSTNTNSVLRQACACYALPRGISILLTSASGARGCSRAAASSLCCRCGARSVCGWVGGYYTRESMGLEMCVCVCVSVCLCVCVVLWSEGGQLLLWLFKSICTQHEALSYLCMRP